MPGDPSCTTADDIDAVDDGTVRIESYGDLEPLGEAATRLRVALTLVDQDRTVLWANRRARELHPELRCGVSQCFATYWGRVARCADCLPRLVFRTGEPQEGLRFRGRPDEAMLAYRVLALPVRDGSGELRWVLESLVSLPGLERPVRKAPGGTDRGIQSHDEAADLGGPMEQALESLLAQVEQSALLGDAVLAIGVDGKVNSWNEEAVRLLGCPAHQAVGRPLSDVAGPEGAQLLLERVRAEPVVRDLRMSWRRADGRTVPVDVNAARIEDGAGQPQGFAAIVRDATTRQQLERQMVRSEKLAAAGSLAAGLAHEIGTPLNVISATAEYLMLDHAEGEPAREELGTIVAETERISRLVRELLSFARGGSTQRTAVKPARAVDQVLRLIRHTADRKNVRLEAGVPESIAAVHTEPDGLQQLLLNLALNAVQAVGQGGLVLIKAREVGSLVDRGGRQVVIEVHDDGPGVPQADRERVFDPFFTTRSDGTGLGLAVCARVVGTHGGDLRVVDSPLGGACFVVQLPAAQEDES